MHAALYCWSNFVPSRPHAHRPRPSDRPRTRRPAQSAPKRHESPTSGLDAALTEAEGRPQPAQLSFADLGLPAPLVTALAASGVSAPFAIQARALPDALAGRDILARAQTGSGKTLAFGLPIFVRLAEKPGRAGSFPRGLVLVPTRELAQQVADVFVPLGKAVNVRVTTVFGGMPIGRQIERLRNGTDLIVATPGRLLDLMERRAVNLDAIEVAVLDEADHMADLGFLPQVTKILDATPNGRQCLLFSATLDRGVSKLVTQFLNEPAIHAVAEARDSAAKMDHRMFVMRAEDKLAVATEIAARPARTLFFVRTKRGADRLARQLNSPDVSSVAIHGDLNQNQRLRALDAFTSGRTRVLVATDVAARGIHVDDVDLVVHYDPPQDHKDYLHRSGRTARAGAAGTVLSFVEPHQTRSMERIHRDASVHRVTPTNVAVGHPEVRAIAASGKPIIVTAEAPRERAQPSRKPMQHKRRGPKRPGQPSGRS